MKINASFVLWTTLLAGCLGPVAVAQTTNSPVADGQETTITGTVSSATRDTIVVRTDSGTYQLFVFEDGAIKKGSIAVGSPIKVISTPGTEPGVRVASYVEASGPTPAASTPSQAKPSSAAKPVASEPIPPSVRQLERDIQRQVRRYGAGVRAGVGLDPEVILVGVHARLGPFFTRRLSFRPNAEFGFGEVTKMFSINLEGVYSLPFAPRTGKWTPYVGVGPSLIFMHRNFEEAAAGDNGIDFGDFDFQAGLSILGGMEFRSGVFFEMKTTIYASPTLRLIAGYTF